MLPNESPRDYRRAPLADARGSACTPIRQRVKRNHDRQGVEQCLGTRLRTSCYRPAIFWFASAARPVYRSRFSSGWRRPAAWRRGSSGGETDDGRDIRTSCSLRRVSCLNSSTQGSALSIKSILALNCFFYDDAVRGIISRNHGRRPSFPRTHLRIPDLAIPCASRRSCAGCARKRPCYRAPACRFRRNTGSSWR